MYAKLKFFLRKDELNIVNGKNSKERNVFYHNVAVNTNCWTFMKLSFLKSRKSFCLKRLFNSIVYKYRKNCSVP